MKRCGTELHFCLGGLMFKQHHEFSGLQITDLQSQVFLMKSCMSLFLVQDFQHTLYIIRYEITTDKVAIVTLVNT